MKILVLMPEESGDQNIYTTQIYYHAKSWVENGHEVTLYIPSKNKAHEEIISGISLVYKKSNPFSLRLRAPINNFINGQDPYDLIIEYWKKLPFFSPLYSKAGKLIFLEDITALDNFQKLHLLSLYKDVAYLVTHEAIKNKLTDLGVSDKRIRIIKPGFSFHTKKASKAVEPTILYIAHNESDALEAIRIFSLLERRDISWKYSLATATNLRQLKRNIAESDISQKTKLFFPLSLRKKYDLINEASIFLILNIIDIDYENIALANLSGTPILTYNYSGIKDYLFDQENGIIIKDHSAENLVNEILKLTRNKQNLLKLIKTTCKAGKKYTWKEVGRESCKYIETL
jgi:glycosyltransferase involved in cell wall biosynthesis